MMMYNKAFFPSSPNGEMRTRLLRGFYYPSCPNGQINANASLKTRSIFLHALTSRINLIRIQFQRKGMNVNRYDDVQ